MIIDIIVELIMRVDLQEYGNIDDLLENTNFSARCYKDGRDVKDRISDVELIRNVNTNKIRWEIVDG